jgi:hypothetical protein
MISAAIDVIGKHIQKKNGMRIYRSSPICPENRSGPETITTMVIEAQNAPAIASDSEGT